MLKNKKNNKDQQSKERNQRILHIYSSHQLVPDNVCKATSLPLKKTGKNSVVNVRGKGKQMPKKQKLKGQSTTLRIKAPEIYERIPVNIVNSNTNSEIEFSNYGETIKQSVRPFRRPLFIDCDQEAIMRQIWNAHQKKSRVENEAATKIQKVFRGFMTRKLLQKYIEQYEMKLNAEINQLKRKTTNLSHSQEDSFYECSLKQSYFLSNKKQKKKSQIFKVEDSENNIDMESSIMDNENQHYISLQEPDLLQKNAKEERKQSLPDKSSFTLNESSIHPQVPQISLSFGNEADHSPHFIHPQLSHQIEELKPRAESPLQQKKVILGQSEDNTRDMISQNVTTSPNYYKHYRSEKSESHFASVQQQQELMGERSVHKIEELKSTEKAKWQQVIDVISQSINGDFTYSKSKELMSAILNFSVKNRQELNKIPEEPILVTPTTLTYRNQPNDHWQSEKMGQNNDFRIKDRINNEKRMKNQNMPLVRKIDVEKSIFERTSIMKEYFLKNMYLEDQHVDKMMELREAVLRQKESDGLMELNYLLASNCLTQDQFIQRLSKMTQHFQAQKKDIEQIREDIYQGFKAQFQLIRNTAIDAQYLGYNIPFCRSMEIFPSQPRWRFDGMMIDELNQLTNLKLMQRSGKKLNPSENEKKSPQKIVNIIASPVEQKDKKEIFKESSSESQSSFEYQQTSLYNKCHQFQEQVQKQTIISPQHFKMISPYDKCAAVSVFQTISNSHQRAEAQEEVQKQQIRKTLKREVYKFNEDSSESQEELLSKKDTDDKSQSLSQFCFKLLVWEVIEDISHCSRIYKTLTFKNRSLSPQILPKKESINFLQMCLKDLPLFSEVQDRLNQKMYPNSRQLLYSMRDCESDDQQSEYIQIGHYQYILNQQICFTYIERYLESYRQIRKRHIANRQKGEVSNEFKVQYQQFSTQRLRHALFAGRLEHSKMMKHIEEYREQILRIQLHMLFDVWNQELIKYRQNKNGYSGIGLNELSLSLRDKVCREMTAKEDYRKMMEETARRIERTILCEDVNDKIQESYEQNICRNDSQWILYTQQALEYGFDLARIIELQLFFECLNEMHIIDQRFASEQSSEQEQSLLNSEQEFRLQKKMLEMANSISDEQDSFYN